jgi:hypothetical protein
MKNMFDHFIHALLLLHNNNNESQIKKMIHAQLYQNSDQHLKK